MVDVREINWDNFSALYGDSSRMVFEKLCRNIFAREHCSDSEVLHSFKNLPGLEVDPILSKSIHKRVSFQAKYFDKTISWNKIRESFEQIVEHYVGQVEVVYLCCNKDFDRESKAYKDTYKILNDVGIEVKIFTGETIISYVLEHEKLACFFTTSIIQNLFDKYKNLTERNIKNLGPRFDSNFNAKTTAENELHLFMNDENAVDYVNEKKRECLKFFDSVFLCGRNFDRFEQVENSVKQIRECISKIKDVDVENVPSCCEWNNVVNTECERALCYLKQEKDTLKDKISRVKDDTIHDLSRNLSTIESILEKTTLIDDVSRNLLSGKVVILRGQYGCGKSQLLGHMSQFLLNRGRLSILLLGQSFLGNESFETQIKNNLELGSIELAKFLDVLDCEGKIRNRKCVIFIDAVNESTNHGIWRQGLESFIEKIKLHEFVKLVLSIRSGCEGVFLSETIKGETNQKKGDIVVVEHEGLLTVDDESVYEFCQYYKKPLLPTYLLQFDYHNPLFLKLLCTSETKEQLNINDLIVELLNKIDCDIAQRMDVEGNTSFSEFRLEFGGLLFDGDGLVLKHDLYGMRFWDLYGFNARKNEYIQALIVNGFLMEYDFRKEETRYGCGYEFFADFIVARCILERVGNSVDELRKVVDEKYYVDGGYCRNSSLVANVCSLFDEKNPGQDCVLYFVRKSDRNIDEYLIESYYKTFAWRSPKSIDFKKYTDLSNKLHVDTDCFFSQLIVNALRYQHSLNADVLHEYLIKVPLNKRDYLWTTYINGIGSGTSLWALIINICKYGFSKNYGREFTEENIKLLLELFAWVLCSSNRVLRDKTSKAMVEVLKCNFGLCKWLLEKFKNVDDPYVIQRLYCVVFGACTKRDELCKDVFEHLAFYVYSEIFNKDKVYADVLLRDYARLIVERCMWEFSDFVDYYEINQNVIRPPYCSEMIPVVQIPENEEKEYNRIGWYAIQESMYPNIGGWYGDFGRYIFEAKVEKFDGVDIKKLYYYALSYIANVLEYSEELFGEYDRRNGTWSRHEGRKLERIGKKYQWITLYNILARLSDHAKLRHFCDDRLINYSGPWDLGVRDFDPTFNSDMLNTVELPIKETIKEKITDDVLMDIQAKEWVNCLPIYLDMDNILRRDNGGVEWMMMYAFSLLWNQKYRKNIGSSKHIHGTQSCEQTVRSYFIRKGDLLKLRECLKKVDGRRLRDELCLHDNSEHLYFSREYVWSPAIASNRENEIIKLCFGEHSFNLLPAYQSFSWAEEYDGSIEDSFSFIMPCNEFIRKIGLAQSECDGVYLDKNGKLSSFQDGRVDYFGPTNFCVRRDLIDEYLRLSDSMLLTIGYAEKKYGLSERECGRQWNYIYVYDGDKFELFKEESEVV